MTFFYRYQDPAGGVKEGTVSASTEAEAYAVLRKGGVRPMKVWAKPGLANRLAAIGKRGYAIIALCALCLVLGAVLLSNPKSPIPNPQSVSQAIPESLPPDLAAGFERFLSDRQQMEADYRKGVIESLRTKGNRETLKERLDAANATLRMSGLKEITLDEIEAR